MVTTATTTRQRKRAAVRRRDVWMRVTDPGKLRRRRKSKHFTQRELAFLTNCTQSAIYLIEAGKLRNISENLACLIAARLDVDVEDYFEARDDSDLPEAVHAS